eukprot:1150796-Pelagomonas_calceolata.AAC.5
MEVIWGEEVTGLPQVGRQQLRRKGQGWLQRGGQGQGWLQGEGAVGVEEAGAEKVLEGKERGRWARAVVEGVGARLHAAAAAAASVPGLTVVRRVPSAADAAAADTTDASSPPGPANTSPLLHLRVSAQGLPAIHGPRVGYPFLAALGLPHAAVGTDGAPDHRPLLSHLGPYAGGPFLAALGLPHAAVGTDGAPDHRPLLSHLGPCAGGPFLAALGLPHAALGADGAGGGPLDSHLAPANTALLHHQGACVWRAPALHSHPAVAAPHLAGAVGSAAAEAAVAGATAGGAPAAPVPPTPPPRSAAAAQYYHHSTAHSVHCQGLVWISAAVAAAAAPGLPAAALRSQTALAGCFEWACPLCTGTARVPSRPPRAASCSCGIWVRAGQDAVALVM